MILIINKSMKQGNALADAFKRMGIVSRAETPYKAMSAISHLYRLIIITNPHALPDEREYIKNLRSYASEIPIMAITDSKLVDPSLYELVESITATAANLYKSIKRFFSTSRKFPPGEYLLVGLDASADSKFVTNFSTVITLTKTESMVLRTLIRSYPIPLNAKEILKYAFSQSKLPDPTSIRTYISSINKKFHHRFERKLVISLDGGYVVLTPQLAEEKHLEFDYRNEIQHII